MPTVVIGVGSNNDHKKNIRQAFDNLQREFGELLISPVYKSVPADIQANSDEGSGSSTEVSYYLNLVISFESLQAIEDIKRCLRAIEQKQMRERNTRYVSIDLDLLLYGSWVGDLDARKIPHDDIELCEFVLRPLADLLPNSIHPVNGYTYLKLWENFKPCLQLKSVVID
jgi:2-amino-4-hydroxy-6-hydroxymethyldihydropteridine diphosphokinase